MILSGLIIFIASAICGFIQGAPVGVAGALVADAALSQNKKRLKLTILAAVLGDTTIAVGVSFAAPFLTQFIHDHAFWVHFIGGFSIIILGLTMIFSTLKSHKGLVGKEDIGGSTKWILGHTGPAMATFLIDLVHPGSIMAILAVAAALSSMFSYFPEYQICFILGIGTGTALIFSLSGIIFWKIGKKVDRFVHNIRYALAGCIILLGIYLGVKAFYILFT